MRKNKNNDLKVNILEIFILIADSFILITSFSNTFKTK